MKLLGVTLSPSMIKQGMARVFEVPEEIFRLLLGDDFVSVVGHENTAHILTKRLGKTVRFNRVNVELQPGDILFCAIPQVRFEMAREYTDEEIATAPFRFFVVEVNEK